MIVTRLLRMMVISVLFASMSPFSSVYADELSLPGVSDLPDSAVKQIVCQAEVAVTCTNGVTCCGTTSSCRQTCDQKAGSWLDPRKVWEFDFAAMGLAGTFSCSGEISVACGASLRCCGDASRCVETCRAQGTSAFVPCTASYLAPGTTQTPVNTIVQPTGGDDGAFCGGEVKVQCCSFECCGTAQGCVKFCKGACGGATQTPE